MTMTILNRIAHETRRLHINRLVAQSDSVFLSFSACIALLSAARIPSTTYRVRIIRDATYNATLRAGIRSSSGLAVARAARTATKRELKRVTLQ